jgi:pimeloyl-ACP methyl ester carboxylesterase
MSLLREGEGRFLDLDGGRIRIEMAGRADGPPLLLLHGGFGSVEDFEPLAPMLAGFRLIAMDSRGQGMSTLGAPLTYARLEADARAVLAAVGVARADVLGYSDGGIVGLRLAARPDGPVRRLVAIGAQHRLLPDDPARGMFDRLTPEKWREIMPESVARYEALNPEPDFPALTAHVRALWLSEGEDAYPGDAVRRITAPVLLIRGDEDRVVARVETAILADLIPGARLANLPWAGHEAQADAPEAVAAILLRFLAEA